MNKIKKLIQILTVIILICIMGMHFGGMKYIIAEVFPEKILNMESLKKVPEATHNFESIGENAVITTSISSWIYLDYQSLDIKRPVSLDYEIIGMDEEDASVPMYYVPSYILQAIVRGVGVWHVELDNKTFQDSGIRLDFSNKEGKTYEFGNFIINRNDLLVEKYLQWFDCAMFFVLFVILGIWLWAKYQRDFIILDFQLALGVIGAIICGICGLPIISYLAILFFMMFKRRPTQEISHKIHYFRLLGCFLIGMLAILGVCNDFAFLSKGFLGGGVHEKIMNVFLILMLFFVMCIFKGILNKSKEDFFVKVSVKAIWILVFYVALDIILKGYTNSFMMGQWLQYVRNNIFSTSTIVNILLLWSFFFAVASMLNVNWATIIYTVGYIILSVGNAIKLHYQGALLKTADIFVLKETLEIADQYIRIEWRICLLVATIGLGLLIFIKRKDIINSLKISVNISAVCFVPLLLAFIVLINNNSLAVAGLDNGMKYKQEKDSLNVFGTGLYYYNMLSGRGDLDKPAGYDASLIQEVNRFKCDDVNTGVKPNVILILAESLFRADKIPGIKYNYDIFKNTNQYIKNSIISPSYGGRTAVAEVEALTGYSDYFMDNDTVIYTTYLKSPQRKIGSLAREFSANGYKTFAMHPNSASFYNRDVVYQCMGFEKFYSINDFGADDDDFLGDGLLKDEKFFEVMIEKLEESISPAFVFGATIAGHSPYEAKYQNTEVKAYSEIYNQEVLAELSRYGQSVKEFDEQLGKLFHYLDKSSKPTLVYVFGDHLPPVAVNSASGYLSNNELKYTMPLITYSNYSNISIEEDLLSLSQIAPQIIKDSGIKHSAYFDFMYKFRERHPILHKDFEIEEDDYVALYEKIQYDSLLGKQFLLGGE